MSSISCYWTVLLGVAALLVSSSCLRNESVQHILVQLKATLVSSQKVVALVVSLFLFRAVTRESMDVEIAFISAPTTDIVLVNRSGESEVLGKPAAGLPDCPVCC